METKMKKEIKFLFCLDEKDRELLEKLATRHIRSKADTLRLLINQAAVQLGLTAGGQNG